MKILNIQINLIVLNVALYLQTYIFGQSKILLFVIYQLAKIIYL